MNLDAYTVRKLAPKLLIAVVAVNISIYLCVAAIDITNVFGRGINQLITAPFHQAAQDKFDLDTLQGPDDTLVFFGVTIAVGILLTLALAGGQLLPMIALTLFPIILAVLAILVTLVIRKALLVILTIASPIAFALWVLPGTDKYFKQWWSLFLKTLMVYPIVAALFAVTNIMAVVTFDSASVNREEIASVQAPNAGQAGGVGDDEGLGDNALNAIIGVILVFIPLFMIPFAFKFAGGAIGSISGQLSDMQKPFSRIAGRERQKRLQKNWGDYNAAKLFRKANPRKPGQAYRDAREGGKGRLRSSIAGARAVKGRALHNANTSGAFIAALPNSSFNPRTAKQVAKDIVSGNKAANMRDLLENNPIFKSQYKGDDEFWSAVIGANSLDDARKIMKSRVEAKDRRGETVMGRYRDPEQLERSARTAWDLVQKEGQTARGAAVVAKAGIATGYAHEKDSEGNITKTGLKQMHEDIARVADGDFTYANQMLVDARGAAKQDRPDLGIVSSAKAEPELQSQMQVQQLEKAGKAGTAEHKAAVAQAEKDYADLEYTNNIKKPTGIHAGAHKLSAEAYVHSMKNGLAKAQDLRRQATLPENAEIRDSLLSSAKQTEQELAFSFQQRISSAEYSSTPENAFINKKLAEVEGVALEGDDGVHTGNFLKASKSLMDGPTGSKMIKKYGEGTGDPERDGRIPRS